ncbi:hypothetical protein MBLNU13_g09037t1 [Cladosporium sp. NU13]
MLANLWSANGFRGADVARVIAILAALVALALGLFRQYLLSSKKLLHLQDVANDTGSNLDDETDRKYEKAEDDSTTGSVRIKALCIHPIKSCRPIEVKRALLTKTGFAYDRCFSFAIEKTPGDWRFLSQRTKPGMALIEQRLWLPHADSNPDHASVKSGGVLAVSFPDPDPPSTLARARAVLETGELSAQPQVTFTVPLRPTPEQIDDWGLRIKAFGVQERKSSGLDYSDVPAFAAVLPKLRHYLQLSAKENLTLMACTPDTLAPADTNLAPLEHIGTPSKLCYTDEQPLHIINLPSVHAVSELLPPENQPLSARRFRPNIFVTGAPAYSEETWKRFRVLPQGSRSKTVAPPSMSVVCRTARCTMPNVEPHSGHISYENPPPGRKRGKPQPSTTVAEYRMVEDKRVNPIALGYMGMHCVIEDSTFGKGASGDDEVYVQVGDEIEVFETGIHRWGSTAHDY